MLVQRWIVGGDTTAEFDGGVVCEGDIATFGTDHPQSIRVPAVRAYHDANQNIGTGAWQPLALNQERYDTDTMHDLAVNNSRLYANTPGIYTITGTILFDANAAGWRGAVIELNGTGVFIASQATLSLGAVDATAVTVATQYELAEGDYVELNAYQDTGVGLNALVLANYSPEFAMVRVGPSAG